MITQLESIQKDRRAILALGANKISHLGAVERTIAHALTQLGTESGKLLAVSRFYRTPAFPSGSGPDYVNCAATISTALPPAELLNHLHRIEAASGRVREARWGARTLDIDLIGIEDLILPDAEILQGWIDLPQAEQAKHTPDRLLLPHPRLQDRAFVLIPLAEIAPGWHHPLTGQTVAEMLASLPAAMKADVRLL
ncbi:MAG: 2-amino-4-hydroxy-6-hydroxymethyldihydropteridine diphosphokinase [Rhodobacteraceae bacterium]|nr:2-amino-4-hydroxy-6-hydroxymethyldihydropteridine diphosphokinase [Paracoccaceae bacterium]